jgi:predicted permease
MLQHYLSLTLRTAKRFKVSFLINLLGLSTGLACSLFIYLWVKDELSIDRFHTNGSRLYQLMTNTVEPAGIRTDESIPGPLAAAIKGDMPEVEKAIATVPFREGNTKGILSFQDRHIKAKECYVEKDFFNMFSYPLLKGNPQEVLVDKHSVLLSDELAHKLFSAGENVIGKSIEWQQEEFTGTYLISGIFKKPPPYSSAQFDMVFSFDLYREKRPHVTKWTNGGTRSYILLKKDTDPNAFSDKIKNYLQQKTPDSKQSLFIRPYGDKYLYDTFENGVQVGGRIEYVRLFSIIALFVLLIACINFSNLSTAQAANRLKEIGVKKAMGADRKALLFQFLSESLLLTLVSGVIAILLVILFLPGFNQITGKQLGLALEINLLISLLLIILFTGLLAGSYPALYLSALKPSLILKGKLHSSSGERWTRKGLVVCQFSVSIILMVSVLVFYKQVNFIQTKHLGYEKDNVILITKEGKLVKESDRFLEQVKRIPGVINSAGLWGNMTKFPNKTSDLSWEGKSPDQAVEFGDIQIDYNLIETLGLELIQGRAFSKDYGREAQSIIFNQTAIEAMGLKEPVGKTIKLWGEDRQIIGVVKDFHAESLYEPIKPLFLNLSAYTNNIAIKIKAGSQKQTIEKINQVYRQYNPGITFEFDFLDANHFSSLYTSENRVAVLSGYFAGVAILISCLGLFGLAAYTTGRRRKEVGIRKVLGSTAWNIVSLLSREFMHMVCIAVIVALPISYIVVKIWLDHFTYSIDLEWWIFVGVGLLVMLVGWLTVAIQTIKAAEINPIQTLREE